MPLLTENCSQQGDWELGNSMKLPPSPSARSGVPYFFFAFAKDMPGHIPAGVQ